MNDRRKTDSTSLCSLFALALTVALCTPQYAGATAKPETPAPAPTSTSSAGSTSGAKASAGANAGASSAIDLSLMNAPSGATIKQGSSYSITGGGSAAPLPAGLCPKGDSPYFQVLFGVLTVAGSTTRTEMECLDKVLAAWVEVSKLAQPKPVEIRYVTISPPPALPASAADASPSSAASASDSCVTGAPAAAKPARQAAPKRATAAARAASAPAGSTRCTP